MANELIGMDDDQLTFLIMEAFGMLSEAGQDDVYGKITNDYIMDEE